MFFTTVEEPFSCFFAYNSFLEKIMNVLILMLYFQEFRLLHFAGEVTYSIQGFLDKNNDLLFRDLKEVWYLVL